MNEKIVYRSPLSMIVIAASLVIALGLGWLWTRPQVSAVRSTRAEHDRYLALAKEADTQIQNLSQLKIGLETTQAAAKELELAFPRDSQLPEVLVQLEAIAAESQMKVNSLSVDTTDKQGGVPINISTSGSFDQLRSFLELIESSRRPIVVQAVAITGGDSGELTTTFTLDMLYLGPVPEETIPKTPQAPGAPAAPTQEKTP